MYSSSKSDGAEVGDAAVAAIEALDSAREARDEGDETEMNRLLEGAYDGEISTSSTWHGMT